MSMQHRDDNLRLENCHKVERRLCPTCCLNYQLAICRAIPTWPPLPEMMMISINDPCPLMSTATSAKRCMTFGF